MNTTAGTSRILSVSELTSDIRHLLEEKFPFIWVAGEISNFRRPVSGHYYFTLKDSNAQISAVMFRGQNRNLKFTLEDGLNVTGFGRISVYEPRGTYQIIFEYLEPKGIGALQVAFDQLKNRLAREGLFDENHKKPLPFLPKKISVITSPTGAVIHDIIHVLSRRFPNIHIEIIPVKVQGDGAEIEIADALYLMNNRGDSDLAILARGGGSLEDLQAFNSELTARAIFESDIPVISAVGHETDFTISDFTADLRAPTPSAAAELAVPVKNELDSAINRTLATLVSRFHHILDRFDLQVIRLSDRLVDPGKRIQNARLRLDDNSMRLIRAFSSLIRQRRQHLGFNKDKLYFVNPVRYINKYNITLEKISGNLLKVFQARYNKNKTLLRELTSKLDALNPVAILSRGYSITRTIPDAVVIRDSDDVSIHQNVEVVLAKGSLKCRIEGKTSDGKKNI